MDYPTSCISSGCILHQCKIPSVSIYPLRRCCAYKTVGQTYVRTVQVLIYPNLRVVYKNNYANIYVFFREHK